eukprot:g8764.t1
MPVQLRPRPSSKPESIIEQVKKYLFKNNPNLLDYLLKTLLTTTHAPPEKWANTFKESCGEYFVTYLSSTIVKYLQHNQASKDSSTVNGVRALKILAPDSAELVVKRLLNQVNDWDWVGDKKSEQAVAASERVKHKSPGHTSEAQTPEIILASVARHIKDDHRGSLREWLDAIGLIDSSNNIIENTYDLQQLSELCENGGLISLNKKDIANLYTYIQAVLKEDDTAGVVEGAPLTIGQILTVINKFQKVLDTVEVTGNFVNQPNILVDKIWDKFEENHQSKNAQSNPSGVGFETMISIDTLKEIFVDDFGCDEDNVEVLLANLTDIMSWKGKNGDAAILLSKVELLHALRAAEVLNGNIHGSGKLLNHRAEKRRIYRERVLASDVLKKILRSLKSNPLYADYDTANNGALVTEETIKRWLLDKNAMDLETNTPRTDILFSRRVLNETNDELTDAEQDVVFKYVAETSKKADGRATPQAFYEALKRILAALKIEAMLDNVGDPGLFVKEVWKKTPIQQEKNVDELKKDLKRCGVSKPDILMNNLAEIQNWSFNNEPAATGGNGSSGLISSIKFRDGLSVGRSLTTEKEVGRSRALRPNTILLMACAVSKIESGFGGSLKKWAMAMNLIDANCKPVMDKSSSGTGEESPASAQSEVNEKKIAFHQFESLMLRCGVNSSKYELRHCYEDIDHVEHGITTKNFLALLNNIILCRNGRYALDKIHNNGYVNFVSSMDLGKYASGKLEIDDILDQLLMNGALDSSEIEQIGEMLKSISSHTWDLFSTETASGTEIEDEGGDAFSDNGIDDGVQKRKFSPAEVAEFFDTCITLSRPDSPGDQLDIIEASNILSKMLRGIDMKYNGSIMAMFQSVKLADVNGKIIPGAVNIRLLKKILRKCGVDDVSRLDIGRLRTAIKALNKQEESTVKGLYDALHRKKAVNNVHEMLEFSVGHSPHFAEACALSPAHEEVSKSNLQKHFMKAELGIVEASQLSEVMSIEMGNTDSWGYNAETIEMGNTLADGSEKTYLTQETLESGVDRLRHLAGGMPGKHMTDANYGQIASLRILARISDGIKHYYEGDEMKFLRHLNLIEDENDIEDNSLTMVDLSLMANVLGLQTSKTELLLLLHSISEKDPHSNLKVFLRQLKDIYKLKSVQPFMHNRIDGGDSFSARIFDDATCFAMTAPDVISKMISIGFDSTESLKFINTIKEVYGLTFDVAISKEWLSEMVDVALVASGEARYARNQDDAHTGVLLAHLLDHIDEKYNGKWDVWIQKYGLVDVHGVSTDRVVTVSTLKEMCKDAGVNVSDAFLADLADLIAAERLGCRDQDLDKDDGGMQISSAQAFLHLIEKVSRAKLQQEFLPEPHRIVTFIDSLGIESDTYKIPKEELLYMFIDSGLNEDISKGLVDSLWQDLHLDGFDGVTRAGLIDGLQMYTIFGNDKSWDMHARGNTNAGYASHEASSNDSGEALLNALKAVEEIVLSDKTQDVVTRLGGINSILGAMGTTAGLDDSTLPESTRAEIIEACNLMIDKCDVTKSSNLPISVAAAAINRINNVTDPTKKKEFAQKAKLQIQLLVDLKTQSVYAGSDDSGVQIIRLGAFEAAIKACKSIINLPPTCHNKENLHQSCSLTIAEIVNVMETHLMDETLDIEKHHVDLDVLDHALVEIDRLGPTVCRVPSDAKTFLSHLRIMSACAVSKSATQAVLKKGGLGVMIQALSLACSLNVVPLTTLQVSEKEEIVNAAARALRGLIQSTMRSADSDPSVAQNMINEIVDHGIVEGVLHGLQSNAKYDVAELLELLATLASIKHLRESILNQRGVRLVIRVLQLHKNNPDVILAATKVLKILAETHEGANAVSQRGGTRHIIKFAMECPADASYRFAAAGAAELLATLVIASKDVEGLRESLIEQEISSAAVQLVNKFPEEENVTVHADRILSEVMSPQSAVYLMSNAALSDIVNDYMPGTQSKAVNVIESNMVEICAAEGGSQAMQSIVTGMANSGKQNELNGFVANVMRTLENNSEHTLTCLEVLNSVTRHAHTSALVSEELINMRVGSRISAALAASQKDDENDSFSKDALSLLQGMETDELDNDDDVLDIGALKAALKNAEKKYKRPAGGFGKVFVKEEDEETVRQRIKEIKDVDAGNIKQYAKKMNEMEAATKKRHNQRMYASQGAGVIAVQLLLKYLEFEELVVPCLKCLINLSYRAPDISTHLVDTLKIVGGLEYVMHRYMETSVEVESLCFLLLSNLCCGGVKIQWAVWTGLQQKILYVSHRYRDDEKVAVNTTRLFGVLCELDELMINVASSGATTIIVHFIECHPKHHELLKLSMDVLGNFFLAEFAMQEDGIDFHERLYSYRAVEVILETISKSVPSKVLAAGLEALYNATAYPPTLERLVAKDLVDTVLKILEVHDYDDLVIEHSMSMIHAICTSSVCRNILVEDGGFQVVIGLIDNSTLQKDRMSVLENTVSAFYHLSTSAETRKRMVALDGVASVSNLISLCKGEGYDRELISIVVAALNKLAADDDCMFDVARYAIPPLMEICTKYYPTDHALLTGFISIIDLLSFNEETLRLAVIHGAITFVINNLCAWPNRPEICVRCVGTLENIAMASAGQAQIIFNEGGLLAIESTHSSFQNINTRNARLIVETCANAMLSMDAMKIQINAEKFRRRNLKARRVMSFSDNSIWVGSSDLRDTFRRM